MHKQLFDAVVRHPASSSSLASVTAEITRRQLIGRVGLLALSGAATLSLWCDPLAAKNKKKSKGKNKKKKQNDEPITGEYWFGSWNTTLSNGIRGIATFTDYDPFNGIVNGNYSNSVGSGDFACVFAGNEGGSLRCRYEQHDDETGGFSITLTSKDRWFGSFFIDSGEHTGESGTWAGVRR